TMSLSLTAIAQEQEMPGRWRRECLSCTDDETGGPQTNPPFRTSRIWTRHDLPGISLSCSRNQKTFSKTIRMNAGGLKRLTNLSSVPFAGTGIYRATGMLR
ncbi:MAG TPA: hypothetical protein PLE90_08500, partial [Dysgonamonadaceae bacterium]|nr:hypothetical protein [Dysgonamonadaceae bacterium]